jgi:hypothetical protein
MGSQLCTIGLLVLLYCPALPPELSTQQSHEQFGEFVLAWNGGQLPMRFYQGLAAAPLKRTSHNWNFKSKLPEQQQQQPSVQRGMAAFLDDQQQQ